MKKYFDVNSPSSVPLSLYIHIPWCIKKCPYCDFNSHEASISFDEQGYVDALIKDLEVELPHIWGRSIVSIFIGGGTPSLFSPESIDKLLSSIRAYLNFNSSIEITLEVNPGTVEANRFSEYKAVGINRLSIGVQSFNDKYLKLLGRIHTSREAEKAISICKGAGFKNFNIDLRFGLPSQNTSDALLDLSTAFDQLPTHISWYQLTIEPNTQFSFNPPNLPCDDNIWSMQKEGQELLKCNDFFQYEISAYAKKKFASIHNTNYWEFGDYIGIGAGAHSKITNFNDGKIERFSRHRVPKRYIELAGHSDVIAHKKILDSDDISLEFMMNTLRLTNGIPANLFFERTGLHMNQIKKELKYAKDRGLLDLCGDQIVASSHGQRYLNDLLQIFMK